MVVETDWPPEPSANSAKAAGSGAGSPASPRPTHDAVGQVPAERATAGCQVLVHGRSRRGR